MPHTPGPWQFGYDNTLGDSEHSDPKGARFIYDANGGSIMGGVRYYPWTPDNLEDWHLISAAPDLLAMAHAFLDFMGCRVEGDATDLIHLAEAAIAKAEGTQA
jgi:hypothetical protein